MHAIWLRCASSVVLQVQARLHAGIDLELRKLMEDVETVDERKRVKIGDLHALRVAIEKGYKTVNLL